MSRSSAFLGVFAAAFIAAMAPTPAAAIPYDNLTYLTFSAPVQIPGVTLDAGTYRFRLGNADSGRNVIQVLSHDGSAVYSMFQTIPDSRTKITDETMVSFMETPAGVAPAVKSIFYGGEYHGYQFVYAKGEPNLVPPPASPQPAITYTPLAVAPVKPAEPTIARETIPSETTSEDAAPSAEFTPEPAALPRTASPLPLFALSGFVSLVLGLGAGLLRRHLS